LYEKPLLSLDSDLQFWLNYVNFIQRRLKDVTLARAKFENRKASIGAYNTSDIVELTIENAMFEEEQSNVQKARNLYENLVSEVAPGHIKSVLAFVAFERRQNNNEKVRDLFYKSFQNALQRKDSKSITFIALQYSRFLAFKSNDVLRACDILDQASSAIKDSKVLYLSQINLLKHLEGLGILSQHEQAQNQGKKQEKTQKVCICYEKAIFESDLTSFDKKDIAVSYLEYLKENATTIGQIKTAQTKLRDSGVLEIPLEEQLNGQQTTQEIQQDMMPGSLPQKRQRVE